MRANLPAGLGRNSPRRRARRGGDPRLRSLRHVQRRLPNLPAHRRRASTGARGRIYLMKGALEGEPVSAETRLHLDRCLECRACETACPSGVEYHRLARHRPRRFGRGAGVGPALARAPVANADPLGLRSSQPGLGAALTLGRAFAWALPKGLRGKLPRTPATSTSEPGQADGRRSHDPARRLRAGGRRAAVQRRRQTRVRPYRYRPSPKARQPAACGAVSLHLDAPEEARAFARRNIDA